MILDYEKTQLSSTHKDIMVYGVPYIDNNEGSIISDEKEGEYHEA